MLNHFLDNWDLNVGATIMNKGFDLPIPIFVLVKTSIFKYYNLYLAVHTEDNTNIRDTQPNHDFNQKLYQTII